MGISENVTQDCSQSFEGDIGERRGGGDFECLGTLGRAGTKLLPPKGGRFGFGCKPTKVIRKY